MANSENFILNSVLCYISTASVSKSIEDILNCSIPFFDYSQIKEARETLSLYENNEQQTSRKGNKSAKALLIEIFDAIKHCKDNNVDLPIFVADAYNAMPPMSGYELIGGTLTVLIDEILYLKDEIRLLKQNRDTEEKCLDNISIKADLIEIKNSLRSMKQESISKEIRRMSCTPSTFQKRLTTDSDKQTRFDLASLSNEKIDPSLNDAKDSELFGLDGMT